MGKLIDLTGQKFGRLTVINYVCKTKSKSSKWLCECACGNKVIVQSGNLKNGHTQSCGCLWRESISTHKQSYSRLYCIWEDMKSRCLNANNVQYHNYGGRGINMCEEWHEFEPFQSWATSNEYKDHLTIDRIDVNGNYCPENCRWVNQKQQQRNKRTNRLLTFNNVTKCVAEWCEPLNIKKETLSKRLRLGWSVEKALTTPVRKTY